MHCVICSNIDCVNHKEFISSITKRILPKLLNKEELNDSIQFLFTQKVCTICNYSQVIDFSGNLTREAIVEHNHFVNDKGSIRGLVCKSCNVIEGKYRKSVLAGFTYEECIEKYGTYFVTKMESYYIGKGGINPMECTNNSDLMEID
jgi:hypothetical protein